MPSTGARSSSATQDEPRGENLWWTDRLSRSEELAHRGACRHAWQVAKMARKAFGPGRFSARRPDERLGQARAKWAIVPMIAVLAVAGCGSQTKTVTVTEPSLSTARLPTVTSPASTSTAGAAGPSTPETSAPTASAPAPAPACTCAVQGISGACPAGDSPIPAGYPGDRVCSRRSKGSMADALTSSGPESHTHTTRCRRHSRSARWDTRRSSHQPCIRTARPRWVIR